MIDRVESFLGDHIEGFFNRKFSSHLEPVELIKGLEKEAKKQGTGGSLANSYLISLGTEDYQRLCSHRVADELAVALKKYIIRADLVMDGKLSICFALDEGLRAGSYHLTARVQHECVPVETETVSHDTMAQTIVLERPSLIEARCLNLPPEHEIATLTVLGGADEGISVRLGERKIYMGRMPRNEFILTDSNVSRVHAWVAYEQHRHVLYDAESRNGTFVNGTRIQMQRLRDGDEIRLGTTALRYGVL
ncbi:hypothetical protein AXF19_12645 [Selenomonas sp. oral taxon 126]|jgi:hypothetical protein|uniref:FhaA domain-containing protein n=1 Tax=Selenomonas sp. oral taxon 126 TaxID=712528 RepID=UPI000807907F|nr:DUF3662 and FHA domain-containing protein [Selenomonas sp. oral taxon 126]ANR71727.1 hypothetical protein AXF19_12645 [Selenomonas sp. oral taxon 126]